MMTRFRKYTQKYKKRQNKTQKRERYEPNKNMYYVAYITIPVNKNRKHENKHVVSQRLYDLFSSMKTYTLFV